jgi:hypothetical protein
MKKFRKKNVTKNVSGVKPKRKIFVESGKKAGTVLPTLGKSNFRDCLQQSTRLIY